MSVTPHIYASVLKPMIKITFVDSSFGFFYNSN